VALDAIALVSRDAGDIRCEGGVAPGFSRSPLTVDGVVANLIDLADAEAQELLGTNEQELSGIWLTVDKPVTQVLGQAAYSDGSIAGIRYRSAKKHPDGFCVVIFEDRLGVSSHNYLEVFNPAGRLDQRLP